MRARLLPLVTLASAVALAACGSTNYADTDNIVPAPDQAQTLKPPKTKIPVTSSCSSTSASVPSSGPLSTEPKITVPSTAPPTTLVTKNIITGTGAVAKSDDELTVDYVGALYKNGKVFDASWSHGGAKGVPFQFELGVGDVIKGWDEGIVGMRVGGRRELIIPPALGYGKKGSPPTIPANSTLIFIVDLLAVK
jgi:peptidylprolyl isomerase